MFTFVLPTLVPPSSFLRTCLHTTAGLVYNTKRRRRKRTRRSTKTNIYAIQINIFSALFLSNFTKKSRQGWYAVELESPLLLTPSVAMNATVGYKKYVWLFRLPSLGSEELAAMCPLLPSMLFMTLSWLLAWLCLEPSKLAHKAQSTTTAGSWHDRFPSFPLEI